MTDDHDDGELKTSTPVRFRDVHAFLCYRRNDGAWYAGWLNDHLNDVEYQESDGTTCHLRFYYDKTAPGVANWKQLHFPTLQTSNALLLICTPGIAKDLSKRGQPDWVYEELNWWTQNRDTAPIVIDTTGEDDRWLPEVITRRWPDINRIDLRREDAETGQLNGDSVFAERIQQRIIGSIQQSEHATVFEDLQRSKKQTARLKIALSTTLVLLLIAIVATVLALQFYKTAEKKRQEQRLALYFSQVALAESNYLNNNVKHARELLESCPKDLRQWEWNYLWHMIHSAKMTIPIDESHTKSVAFSADGKYIASAGETVKMWNSESGKEVLSIPIKSFSVGFSPDNRHIASAGDFIKLWDIRSGKEALTFPYGGELVAYSSDGKLIVSGDDDGLIKLWDVESGRPLMTLNANEKGVMSVAISPDGRHIVAVVGNGSEVKLWDTVLPRKPITLGGDVEELTESVAFNHNGTCVASGGGHLIKFWDVKTGLNVLTIHGAGENVRAVAFSPDGKLLASGSSDNTIQLWDVNTGVKLNTIRGHEHEVLALAFDPKGTRIASASWDRTIKVWDATTSQEAQTLRGHTSVVNSIAISADGAYIASGSQDGTIRVWNLATCTEVKTLFRGPMYRRHYVAFNPSPNSQILAASVEQLIKLWDAKTGKELMTLRGHEKMVNTIAFSRNGKCIVSGGIDGTIKLWNAIDGTELKTFHWEEDGPYGVLSVDFSPDGTNIVAAGNGTLIKVWNVTNGTVQRTLHGHETASVLLSVGSVSYSPDGKLIVSGDDDGLIKLWDAETGRELRTFRGHQGMVFSVKFSPDGKRIISGSMDMSVKLWNTQSDAEVMTLRGHSYQVLSVVFSPDGKHIISASTDETIKVW